MRYACRALAAIGVTIAAVALTACGGGSAAGPAASVPIVSVPAAVATASPSAGGSGTLAFSVANRLAGTAAPASVAVFVSGQTAPLGTLNLTGCGATSGIATCNGSVNAPAGSDTFVVATYAGANGGGQKLSTATVPAKIVAGSTTRVALATGVSAATVTAILGAGSVPVGNPASVAVSIVAYDSSGDIVVGPGYFSSPVTLTDSDTSGTTSLSATSVTTPGTSVSLNYNGNSLASATITPSLGGTPGTAATFAPAGYAFVDFLTPSSIGEVQAMAAGPDGNVWFASGFGGQGLPPNTISKITPAGTITSFTGGLDPSTAIDGMAPLGNVLWWGDGQGNIGSIVATGAAGTIGTVTPASSYTTPCQSSTAACGSINWMVAGPDGNAWFADSGGYLGRITPAGAVQEWTISLLSGWPTGSSSAPEEMAFSGNTLYVADGLGYVDQITLAGDAPVSVDALPITSGCGAYGLTIGTDGNVWFADLCGNIGIVPVANFTSAGMLQWNVSTVIGTYNSIAFLASSPAGVWGTDGDFCGECSATTDNNVYQFLDPGGLTATQGPPVVAVPAFPATSSSYLYAIVLGPDGNIWTGPSGQATSSSPVAKVLFGGSSASSVSSIKRASPFVSHRRRAGSVLRAHQGFGLR